MPYRASPSIPPGMDPAAWQRVIDAMIREARTITNLLATGRPLTRDQLTRAATIRAIMGETAGALTDAGKAADYLFSKHLAPQLHASLNDLDAALAGHPAVAAADITGLTAGDPVSIRVVVQDSTDYADYLTHYEVFVNGSSADSGNIRFANDSRYIIFDTAPDTGPARYDDFALETLTPQSTIEDRLPILRLSEFEVAAISGVERVRLYWTTLSGDVVRPLISNNLSNWQAVIENNTPLEVSTNHGTIRWKEIEIPSGFQDKAFFRLEKD